MQQQNSVGPCPWGPGKGSKGQLSLYYNNKVIFLDFYTKLCVFLQIKDIKHIKRDFCSDAWVMPQEWDLGAAGVRRGSSIFYNGHEAYQIDWNDE